MYHTNGWKVLFIIVNDNTKTFVEKRSSEGLGNFNSDSINSIHSFTKVYYGSTDADNELLKFIDRSTKKIDSCISSIGPSVIIEVNSIKQKRIEAVKKSGLKLRYVTEITKDNVNYIREMMKFS
ncbi:MAG: hypothetical protein ACTHJ7_09330, partial [Candidatus Nitrosocosmicus sp.]